MEVVEVSNLHIWIISNDLCSSCSDRYVTHMLAYLRTTGPDCQYEPTRDGSSLKFWAKTIVDFHINWTYFIFKVIISVGGFLSLVTADTVISSFSYVYPISAVLRLPLSKTLPYESIILFFWLHILHYEDYIVSLE